MRIGILGAGQLARMMALAGQPLGCQFVFIDPAPDACAASLGEHHVLDWSDQAVLPALAHCDRVTFDFENVDAAMLADLAQLTMVRPSTLALETSQDRLKEKNLLHQLGLPVARYAAVSSRPELLEAIEQVGLPAVIKTRWFGYDGKGQMVIQTQEDLEAAWQALGGHALIAESCVDFSHECALTAVRDGQGQVRFYPLTHTLHKKGILRFALSPSAVNAPLEDEAKAIVAKLAESLDYVGCLTVEFFATDSGLVVNEIAPRVHNSAHWTIEGTECSQFENHIRAIADWPLGDTEGHGVSLMMNFIGRMPGKDMLQLSGLHWHDYGKAPRTGRKVGHATWQLRSSDELAQKIEDLSSFLAQDELQCLRDLIEQAG